MTYVPNSLRQLVAERANSRCEYCQFPQSAAMLAFEMEHIIAEKHGGKTEEQNLALACPYCNRAKGTDLGSIDLKTGALTPFYNPRLQIWEEHFVMRGAEITPLTAEGRVTAAILQFNDPHRIQERERLIKATRF
jgi:glutaredoxin